MKTRFGHAAAFGTLASIGVIVLGLLVYLTGIHEAVNNLSMVIAITVFCIGLKKWREESGGYLTYGQAYGHLMLQTLVYAVIITIWTAVFVNVIAPGFFEDQLLKTEAELEKEGLSQAQIEMAMSWTRKIMSPTVMTIGALFGNIILYGLINLIVAAIMKKDPPPAQYMPPVDSSYSNMPPPNYPPQA